MTHEEFESIAALDAVGAATPDEQRTLRAHLDTCADCRRAHDEYTDAATLLARDLEPVEPPSAVRNRIVNAVGGNVTPIDTTPRYPWWLATAATFFLALWGWREIGVRVERERAQSLQRDVARLQTEFAQTQQQKEKLAAALSSITAAETETISLAGAVAAPSASARVYMDPKSRRAVVFFHNLPANPADRSYQLWIIRADQPNPQSAGVFDASKSGSATITIENLPVATEIKALAVTLEPRGGVPQPTNTNFYVMGKT